MAVSNQKLRILYLMDILLERTDEEHLLNAMELCRILEQEYDIPTDRRTVYTGIETLSQYGLDIVQKKGKEPGYFIGGREYELPELRLLVDAVQSSRFITGQKSRELIRKLEKLCSRSQAAALQHEVFIVNRSKAENETIYYQVDTIHNAIEKNREIAFQYAEWTPQKRFRLRREGASYVMSPWALTWNSDNYYLIAYDAEAEKIKHYRVDKMQRTKILETERRGRETFRNFDLAEFSKKTFGMFGGRDIEVSFCCENTLAGVMLDRFGREIPMIPADEEHFRTRAVISVSPQFFGWTAGLGAGIRIEGPEEVKAEYQLFLEKILQNYRGK
ncbi:MAG: WYL domain-containing protein [Lachnospiraceae bacterium]|nr:WYL domain-containing protein [Lachnospiraceae bacterium]